MKASKIEVLLSPVAYLMYARLSIIIVCRQLGKYVELMIVHAMDLLHDPSTLDSRIDVSKQ